MQQQHDEVNIAAIYNGEPAGTPQQEAAKLAERRIKQAKLPKFELAEGERLYIPRDKLDEIDKAYFAMFDDMKQGLTNASPESKSFMESVIFESYRSTIYKMQEEYYDAGEHARLVTQFKSNYLAPRKVRPWFFGRLGRKRPNYALHLIIEQAQLAAEDENSIYREKIANLKKFLYGMSDEELLAKRFLETIIYELVPGRKQKHFKKVKSEYLNELVISFIQSQTAQDETPVISTNELFRELVQVLVSPRKKEQFVKRNGEYLKGLIAELMPVPGSEPASEPESEQEAADEQSETQPETPSEYEQGKALPLEVPDDADMQTVFNYEPEGTYEDDEAAIAALEDQYFPDDEDELEEPEEPEQQVILPPAEEHAPALEPCLVPMSAQEEQSESETDQTKYFKFKDKAGNEMYCALNPFDAISIEKLKKFLGAETLEEVTKEEYDAQNDETDGADADDEEPAEPEEQEDTGGENKGVT